jgi:hypothetical protein
VVSKLKTGFILQKSHRVKDGDAGNVKLITSVIQAFVTIHFTTSILQAIAFFQVSVQ